ncbi:MAG: Fe-S-containing protein [Candidatus Kapabacteria bacterium]|nr:Fe-S-containing protein [Candidatus Kapabacteria bacterium]
MLNTLTIDDNVISNNHITKSAMGFLRFSAIILILMTTLGQSYNAIAQVVKHPASEVSTTARHYKYIYNVSQTQYINIEYILVRASNGDIKSSFNACDVCYPEHKGYSQKGTNLRCNNCGKIFAIDALGSQGAGGCWPGLLIHSLEGDDVALNVTDLAKGDYYFLLQTTDVAENLNNQISLVNINNNELRVKLSDMYPKFFRIFSLNGILCNDMNPYSPEFSVEISDLSSGMYYVLTEYKGLPVIKYFKIIR